MPSPGKAQAAFLRAIILMVGMALSALGYGVLAAVIIEVELGLLGIIGCVGVGTFCGALIAAAR